VKACNVVLFALPLIPPSDPLFIELPSHSIVALTDGNPDVLLEVVSAVSNKVEVVVRYTAVDNAILPCFMEAPDSAKEKPGRAPPSRTVQDHTPRSGNIGFKISESSNSSDMIA